MIDYCTVLSTTTHQYCSGVSSSGENCECLCHLPLTRQKGKQQKRPHSYPREDWTNIKPSGWHEARRKGIPTPKMSDYQRRLFGIKERTNKTDADIEEMVLSGRSVERIK